MKRLIAFNGQMFAGKTMAIQGLETALKRKVGVTNVKFAQPLYDIQSAVYDIIGQPIPHPKDRHLLQWLGTDWGRKKDPNLWVNIWKQRVGEELEITEAVVTCDDCRFDNEAEVVKSLGGIIVRVTAPLEVRQARAKELGMEIVSHASEAGISDKYVDYTIENSGTAQELYAKMAELASKL